MSVTVPYFLAYAALQWWLPLCTLRTALFAVVVIARTGVAGLHHQGFVKEPYYAPKSQNVQACGALAGDLSTSLANPLLRACVCISRLPHTSLPCALVLRGGCSTDGGADDSDVFIEIQPLPQSKGSPSPATTDTLSQTSGTHPSRTSQPPPNTSPPEARSTSPQNSRSPAKSPKKRAATKERESDAKSPAKSPTKGGSGGGLKGSLGKRLHLPLDKWVDYTKEDGDYEESQDLDWRQI
jgi:hypothetical protein